jgi:hypothetical protein
MRHAKWRERAGAFTRLYGVDDGIWTEFKA